MHGPILMHGGKVAANGRTCIGVESTDRRPRAGTATLLETPRTAGRIGAPEWPKPLQYLTIRLFPSVIAD